MNITAQSGNLTRDPELRFLNDGTPVCLIRIAVDEAGRLGGAGYFDVEEFGARGEAAAKHLKKGSEVNVSGKLKWRDWTDKDTGKSRETLWIRGHIDFIGPKPDTQHQPDGPTELPEAAPTPIAAGANSRPGGAEDDDIPF
jgi:single-strand DNA-binding protein